MNEFNLLWEFNQHRRIHGATLGAISAGSTADRASKEVSDVRESVDRLSLICQAMWELLGEHTSISNDDLLAKVREIDLRDGKLDGKAKPSPMQCPACKRPNRAGRARCLYCGDELAESSAFDQV